MYVNAPSLISLFKSAATSGTKKKKKKESKPITDGDAGYATKPYRSRSPSLSQSVSYCIDDIPIALLDEDSIDYDLILSAMTMDEASSTKSILKCDISDSAKESVCPKKGDQYLSPDTIACKKYMHPIMPSTSTATPHSLSLSTSPPTPSKAESEENDDDGFWICDDYDSYEITNEVIDKFEQEKYINPQLAEFEDDEDDDIFDEELEQMNKEKEKEKEKENAEQSQSKLRRTKTDNAWHGYLYD